MLKLYQEIEGHQAISEQDLEACHANGEWAHKKENMSKKIKDLFDDALSLEQKRSRLRFERAAACMWAMNPVSVLVATVFHMSSSSHLEPLS